MPSLTPEQAVANALDRLRALCSVTTLPVAVDRLEREIVYLRRDAALEALKSLAPRAGVTVWFDEDTVDGERAVVVGVLDVGASTRGAIEQIAVECNPDAVAAGVALGYPWRVPAPEEGASLRAWGRSPGCAAVQLVLRMLMTYGESVYAASRTVLAGDYELSPEGLRPLGAQGRGSTSSG